MAFIYKFSYATRTATIQPKAIGKIIVAREEGEVFFREKFVGSLVVAGDDYHFLRDAKIFAVECCQEIALFIERTCSSGTELFWQGYFNVMDIEWDEDNLQATIKKVQTRDDYSAIFSNWHKEINWLDYKKAYRPNSGKKSFGQAIHFHQITPKTAQYNPNESDIYWRGFSFNNGVFYLVKESLKGTAEEDIAEITLPELSQFLSAEINPVTGKYNYLKDVVVMQMSDAKRPGASTAAITGMVTLRDVLNELKLIYNAHWFINPEGKIQIEHISYFPHLSYEPAPVTLDLTEDRHAEAIDGKKQYWYQTEQLKGIEGVTWNLNEAAYNSKSELAVPESYKPTREFSGAYMFYSDSCVPKTDKGEKTTDFKSVSLFVTDWLGLINRPDTFPEQGWALAHVTNYLSTTGIELGWVPVSGQRVMNGCLSATRLFFDFGRYNCSFHYGMLSPLKEPPKEIEEGDLLIERPTRTKTVKNIKYFTPVELGMCCGSDFDFSGMVKHPLASAAVISQVEYDLDVDSIEMSIQAANLCSDVPFPDYNEEDEPVEGCKPAGMLIRRELVNKSRTDSGIYYVIVSTYTEYYADGACGEYTTTSIERSQPIPKRGNGPR
ncbi:hypothetical protein [Dyadobacter crusticola]|uniref:hypothetical protein n=1 Tax=Dyadobacter crusticola TaxID=292407 RepID=UPI0004E1FF0C|nr:hypothetical protein [Dyadobacter crusticola]